MTFSGSLAELLVRVGQTVSTDLDAILKPEDLTLVQWRVLDALSDGAGCSMSELSKRTSIRISALSKLIDRMVVRSMVLRKQDDTDHRIIKVLVSDYGLEIYQRCLPRVATYQEQLTRAFASVQPEALSAFISVNAAATLPDQEQPSPSRAP